MTILHASYINLLSWFRIFSCDTIGNAALLLSKSALLVFIKCVQRDYRLKLQNVHLWINSLNRTRVDKTQVSNCSSKQTQVCCRLESLDLKSRKVTRGKVAMSTRSLCICRKCWSVNCSENRTVAPLAWNKNSLLTTPFINISLREHAQLRNISSTWYIYESIKSSCYLTII